MSREYVSTVCNYQRISVIAHRSASDKRAVDSLVLFVYRVLFPQRERKSVWHIVSKQRFVNDKLMSGKLSKCLHVYITLLYARYVFIRA